MTVYASWNGATQVSSWRVMGGSAASALHVLVAAASRTGFETAIGLAGKRPKWVKVEALDSGGRVLGTSARQAVHYP